MKNLSQQIIKLVFGLLCLSNSSHAQLLEYTAMFPEFPFDFAESVNAGNNKTTVWLSTAAQTEGDESGQLWSKALTAAHQYQRYEYIGDKMQLISQYDSIGDKMWSEEYFYKNNLLSATERLEYDSLQNPKKAGGFVYLYYKSGRPFQRVQLFGFPNNEVRLLCEFKFNAQKQVLRQKTTAIGYGPGMDSLLHGMKNKEVATIVYEYRDSIISTQKFKNLYLLDLDILTICNQDSKPIKSTATNAAGKLQWIIQYEYESGLCSKKTVWNPSKTEPKELEVTKVEYFSYDNGLIQTHIIEQNKIQTTLEYSHFAE